MKKTPLITLLSYGTFLLWIIFFWTIGSSIQAQEKSPLDQKEWWKGLVWRSIGPANMGGRITAIAVYEKDPSTYYVATASGGLLKTVNNGITFQHQFDKENTVSIGDVCVCQSNSNIVWVGTGEANPRNSVSYGDGVYKSIDGGKTWKHMGLKDSFQIGKIILHPDNSDMVYVGALGRLYGSNKERGLFKTIDGGKTWKKILYIDDKTGVIDIRMNPENPEHLLVATYERKRDEFDGNDPQVKWGAGSGLYKTEDGGKTFQKITKGLPTVELGRIGLDWSRKNAQNVYMVLESEKIGGAPKGVRGSDAYMGITGRNAPGGGAQLSRVVPKGPSDKAGLKSGDIIVAFDKKNIKSYTDLIRFLRQKNGGDKVQVKIRRENKIQNVPLTLGKRSNYSRGRPFSAYLGGQKENITKQGKDAFQYGGVYKSTDGGDSWKRINSLNPRPMYFSQIRVDPSDEKYIYVLGIALHRSNDGGKTFRRDGGRGVHPDHHALWINPNNGRHMVLGTDGGLYVSYDRMQNWDHYNHFAIGQFYHVGVDPRPNYKAYGGLQDNGSWGGPAFTRRYRGPVNSDWVRVGGGDGFRCIVDPNDIDLVYFSSQNGNLMRRNFRTGEFDRIRPPKSKTRYRFNWNTPFILSHHNSRIYYSAGNYVFKSLDRGNKLQVISPEITRSIRGSATALGESPKNPNVLYAGTDDGALWVTQNGGKEWKNITKNLKLTGYCWVSTIEASRFAEGRAYVVLDGHRSDDDNPHVYATEDFGDTWRSLNANLPWGSTRCLREDVTNPDLLYLGTEFGAWFSINRGDHWFSLNTNLPTVAVHEIAVHPKFGEIVAATHGRSLWVLDVSALQTMDAEDVNQTVRLYKPRTAIRWMRRPSRGSTNRSFAGTNPPSGASIYYSLPEKAKNVLLNVFDVNGKLARKIKGSEAAGLQRITWDLRRATIKGLMKDKKNRRRRSILLPVKAGTYRIVLNVNGESHEQTLRVANDPTAPPPSPLAEEKEEEDDEERLLLVD